jgi:hypothetical protein
MADKTYDYDVDGKSYSVTGTKGSAASRAKARSAAVPPQQPFKSGKMTGHMPQGTHAGMSVISAGEMHAKVTDPIKKF